MANIGELLARKGSKVECICPSATVLEATQLMNREKIGSLVVSDGEQVVGIFTERDVLRRVVVEQRSPASTPVGEVMTTDVACATPETSLDEARAVMKNRRIRHLPVCTEEGKLLGIISIGDLNAWEINDHETTIHWLSEYIQGRV